MTPSLSEQDAQAQLPALDPATGEVLAWLPRCGASEVGQAVDAACASLERHVQWRRPAFRAELLSAIGRAIEAAADELAILESRDTGKPLAQARTDVAVAARYFHYYAGWADKIYGDQIPLGDTYLDYTLREPWGVCGQIIPWNYPPSQFRGLTCGWRRYRSSCCSAANTYLAGTWW